MAGSLHRRFAALAERHGFELDDAQLAVLAEVGAEMLADCERLDALHDVRLPVRSPRQEVGERPDPAGNPVNGWVWRCRLEGAAEGPLAGRTVALKDTVSLAGVPLLNGSELMEGFVPTEDATIVTRLLDAGATIVGKTAVPALCCEGSGLTAYPAPAPLNPAAPDRMPGGSSSGSAAVVANGEADLAIGGDQGGSIRIPAAWCGCVGHKPTFGLVPYTGVVGVDATLDHVGPLARTVADCAAMLGAIAGPDGLDPRQADVRVQDYAGALGRGAAGLRVGVLREGFGFAGASEPEVDERVRAVTAALVRAGAHVEEVSIPVHLDGMAIWNAICMQGLSGVLLHGSGVGFGWRGHYQTELADFHHRALGAMAHALPDTVKVTALAGELLRETRGHHYYAKAQNLARALRDAYDRVLARVDVLVMPSTPMRAPAREQDLGPADELRMTMGLSTSNNVAPFNVTGHPSLSVPVQPAGEVPIGLLVTGRRFDDATVLAAGAAVESAAAELDL